MRRIRDAMPYRTVAAVRDPAEFQSVPRGVGGGGGVGRI